MKRTCEGKDDTLITPAGEPCGCGRTFDDAECSVIWPHERLLSREEKDELLKQYGVKL